ncbi:hypothetical protein ACI2KT_36240 [Ensifer adhaerens]|uniref:hypothetical protein n=1 Tax=Ensifer adhaerens TaxID=106592 RepID=UPI00384AD894
MLDSRNPPLEPENASETSTRQRDVESESASSVTQSAWLQRTTSLKPVLLACISDTPEKLDSVLEAAKYEAQRMVAQLQSERRESSKIGSFLRSTTAWVDAKPDGAFRDALKRLDFSWRLPGDGNQPEQIDNILALTRDVFTDLRKRLDVLSHQAFGDDAQFLKEKMAGDIDGLIDILGRAAYDDSGIDRVKKVAVTSATLTLTALPMAFAYYSAPTSYYYLGALAGAYSRTLLQAIGLILNAGTTNQMIWEHVKERHVVWAVPSALFGVQAFMAAAAGDLHDEGLAEKAEHALKISESIAFLTAAGVAEGAIFLFSNHPETFHKYLIQPIKEVPHALFRKQASSAARFARGDFSIPADYGEQVKHIRDTFKFGSGLLEAVTLPAAEMNRLGDLSATQAAIMNELNNKLSELTNNLDQFVGDIKAQVRSISEQERGTKRKVGVALATAGAILGTVSSMAAWRVPALLVDYIPYYVAAEILLIVRIYQDHVPAKELARLFGTYFGGTTLGVPFAMANLITLFSFGDGAFDITSVEHGVTPKNATSRIPHPSPAVAKHPGIHILDGKVNFGIFVGVTILLTLLAAGRIGDWLSSLVLAIMKEKTAADPEAAIGVAEFEAVFAAAVQSDSAQATHDTAAPVSTASIEEVDEGDEPSAEAPDLSGDSSSSEFPAAADVASHPDDRETRHD